MSLVRSVVVPLASLALAACAVPKFAAVDSHPPDPAPDTNPDPPVGNTICEEADQPFCTAGACGKICHRTDLPRKVTFSHCDKPVVVEGVHTDNCEDHNVCLEPAPNTSQGTFCFALCGKDADCPGGSACGERPLSDGTLVRVCDPGYQNCEEGCCDPTEVTGSACSFRPCYLVSPPNINRGTSWTVCEYTSGGGRKDDPCTLSRDCIEGLTCVGAESRVKGSGTCLVVCDPSKPDACTNGHCQPFPKQWGYCL